MQFSVLMSLYYKESPKFLNECLLSLDKQTLSIPELVCVFDGPLTDELEEIVHVWSKKLPIKIIKLNKNVGLGNALNEGLKHCSYNIVARMDTDDICLPERFERQTSFLKSHPDVVILGTNIHEFEFNSEIITSSRKVPSSCKDIVEFSKWKNPFNHMSVVFRKDVIVKVGGYKHHYLMEDYNLWLRVLSHSYNVANLPEYLMLVRAGSGMISRRHGFKYIMSEFVLARLKYNLKLQSFSSAVYVFIIRSLPRLLPVKLLAYFYKKSRK